MKTIFLSASIPDPRRDPKYFQSADATLIREAVRGLTAALLPRGILVFGGHPAISPMVALIGQQLGALEHVRIYQSRWFDGQVPQHSLMFKYLNWTKRGLDLESSLQLMREEMLRAHKYDAGVFIGGMEGVEHEFLLFRKLLPFAPVFPVASCGAASSLLFQNNSQHIDPGFASDLATDLVYGDLFRRIVDAV